MFVGRQRDLEHLAKEGVVRTEAMRARVDLACGRFTMAQNRELLAVDGDEDFALSDVISRPPRNGYASDAEYSS